MAKVAATSTPVVLDADNGRVPRDGDSAEASNVAQKYRVEKTTLLTKDEVERRLDSTKESIALRLDALQGEFSHTGEGLRKTVTEKPLVGVAIAVAAGVAIGFLFGGLGGKRRRRTRAVEDASHDIATSVRTLLESGATPEDAANQAVGEVRSALGHAVESGGPQRGIIARSLLPVLAAGTNIAVREGIKLFVRQLESGPQAPAEDDTSAT